MELFSWNKKLPKDCKGFITCLHCEDYKLLEKVKSVYPNKYYEITEENIFESFPEGNTLILDLYKFKMKEQHQLYLTTKIFAK